MLKTVSSITNAIGALNFKGTWNASTNTPTIVSGVGVKGDYFVVSVAGSTTIDGISNWGVGDWITYNGAVWQRVEGGADLNGVNVSFTGTASGPTYETSNLASGLTMADNEIDADGTDTNIDVIINPKGTGGLGVGGNTTGVVAGATITSKFCVKHEGANQTGGFVHANNTTAASGAGIFACRSRGTLAAPTIVQNNDNLATISFAGSDGVDLALAARISVEVDGTPGSNDMPGRMVFSTTPNGTQAPVDAVKIDSAQKATFFQPPILDSLTASTALALDASKNVVSVTNTGTGNNVLATSPTLTTPTLGAATATSINKVALTAPATGSTLTIADGKTLTANQSLTLAGTDATTMTFPATSATIARIDAAQTFASVQTFAEILTSKINSGEGDSGSIANGATANIITLPAVGVYLVTARQSGGANGGIRAAAIVAQGSGANALTSLASAGGAALVSGAGFNVDFTNNAGGALVVRWSFTKLSS
jgi:hypothetical protein